MTEVISNLSLITRLQCFERTLKHLSKGDFYRLTKILPNSHIAGFWFLIEKKSADIKNKPESLKRLLETRNHDLCNGESEEKKTNFKEFLKLIDQVILDLSQEKTSRDTVVIEHEVTMSLKPYFNIEFLSFFSSKEKLDIQRECLKTIDCIKQSKILDFNKCLLNVPLAFGNKELLFYFKGHIELARPVLSTVGGYYNRHLDQVAIVKHLAFQVPSKVIHELAHRYDELYLTEKKRKKLNTLYKKVCTYKDDLNGIDLKKGDMMPMYYLTLQHQGSNENFTVNVLKNRTKFKAKQKELVFESLDSGLYYDGELFPIIKERIGGYNYFPSRYAKTCFYEWFAEMCTMITLNQNNVKDWITNKFLEIVNQEP